MGVYIKGLEMPKEQIWSVEVIYHIKEDGSLFSIAETVEPSQVVEIPTPHGQLIDNDLMTKEYYKKPSYQHLCNILNNAPTILEAEV